MQGRRKGERREEKQQKSHYIRKAHGVQPSPAENKWPRLPGAGHLFPGEDGGDISASAVME